ncbi:MAG: maleylpyruvate isomerase family mycothiol-dependent enzyme [Terrimesophilobacter sp.]
MTPGDYLTRDPELLDALQLAHEGTEFFDHTLGALPDGHFLGASLLPGWSRRHVISHVAYNAQALARLAAWASTGVKTPMYESAEARNRQIEEGASLSPNELRTLHRDSAETLDSAWRELSDQAWNALVSMQTGPPFAATHTIWLRTREVWLHAVDLDSGASFADFPPRLVERLLVDVVSTWRNRTADNAVPNFVLVPTDRGRQVAVGSDDGSDAITLRGTAVDLARWATGRSILGITVDSVGQVPAAPRWL